jgi:hypothetical protein
MRTAFSCTAETEMPAIVRIAAALIATPYFLRKHRKHVDEETPNFAADINRKLAR